MIDEHLWSFATSHAVAIRALTVKSAGTTLACTEPSQWIDRSNPVPAPAATPVGPYRLSIQPRIGSRYVEITTDKVNVQFLQYLYIA